MHRIRPTIVDDAQDQADNRAFQCHVTGQRTKNDFGTDFEQRIAQACKRTHQTGTQSHCRIGDVLHTTLFQCKHSTVNDLAHGVFGIVESGQILLHLFGDQPVIALIDLFNGRGNHLGKARRLHRLVVEGLPLVTHTAQHRAADIALCQFIHHQHLPYSGLLQCGRCSGMRSWPAPHPQGLRPVRRCRGKRTGQSR